MKTVFNNSELVHIYAKQSQYEGRNSKSTMFFEGSKFYSYGKHYCISNILESGAVLFNSSSYSITTSQHVGAVKYALNYLKSYSVPAPEFPENSKNLKYCKDKFNEYLTKQSRARKYSYVDDMREVKETLYYLLNNFKWDKVFKDESKKDLKYMVKTLNTIEKDPSYLFDTMRKNQREQAKKLKAEKLAKQKAIQKENAQKIKDWKAGKDINLSWNITTPYLRLKNGFSINDQKFVETSKGISVPIESAQILWGMIKAGNDIKGHNIDGYTVISINGTLKIGCHDIPIAEVKEMGFILDSLKGVK